jgi:hypothetical protein
MKKNLIGDHNSLGYRIDRSSASAEAGEAVIQAPNTVLGEPLYSVSREEDVCGVTLSGTPENAERAGRRGPASSLLVVRSRSSVRSSGSYPKYSLDCSSPTSAPKDSPSLSSTS